MAYGQGLPPHSGTQVVKSFFFSQADPGHFSVSRCSQADLPPSTGWKAPWWGDVDASLQIETLEQDRKKKTPRSWLASFQWPCQDPKLEVPTIYILGFGNSHWSLQRYFLIIFKDIYPCWRFPQMGLPSIETNGQNGIHHSSWSKGRVTWHPYDGKKWLCLDPNDVAIGGGLHSSTVRKAIINHP